MGWSLATSPASREKKPPGGGYFGTRERLRDHKTSRREWLSGPRLCLFVELRYGVEGGVVAVLWMEGADDAIDVREDHLRRSRAAGELHLQMQSVVALIACLVAEKAMQSAQVWVVLRVEGKVPPPLGVKVVVVLQIVVLVVTRRRARCDCRSSSRKVPSSIGALIGS
jgi:hypothetical protein